MIVQGRTPWMGALGAALCLEGCMASIPVNYVGPKPDSSTSTISSPRPAYGKAGGSSGSSAVKGSGSTLATKPVQVLLLTSSAATGTAAANQCLQLLANLGVAVRSAPAASLLQADFSVADIRFALVIDYDGLSSAESRALRDRLEIGGRSVMYVDEAAPAGGGVSSRMQTASDGSTFTLALASGLPSSSQVRYFLQNAGVSLASN